MALIEMPAGDAVVLDDLPEAEYHADPVPEGSLSQSGAKLLLDCPARYRQEKLTPRSSRAFDVGHAVHASLLGVGAEVVSVPGDLLSPDGGVRSNAAKAWVTEAKAEGKVVVRADIAAARPVMEAAVREHAVAGVLFREGTPERSIFWRDPETSVMLRARLDWVTTLPSGRPVIVDFKTTEKSCRTDRFAYSAWDYGYYLQDPWYREALAVTGAEDPAFLFVVQEVRPPYLVNVMELDAEGRAIGAMRAREARRLFLECMTTGQWPGYPEQVQSLRLPFAALRANPIDTEGDTE